MRKVTAIVILTLMSVLMLSACAEKKADIDSVEVDNYVFNEIDFEYSSDMSPRYGFFLKGDFLYFLMYGNETYPSESEDRFHMCKYNTVDNELTVLFDIDVETWSLKTFSVTDEDDIVMLHVNEYFDEEQMVYICEIEKRTYGEDGTVKNIVRIGGDELPDPESSMIYKCKFDDGQNVYMVYQNSSNSRSWDIYKFDKDGTFLGNVLMNDITLNSFIIDNEGNAVISYSAEEGAGAVCLDFGSGKISEKIEYTEDIYTLMDGHRDITFLMSDGLVLYTYDRKTNQKEPVLKWMQSNLMSENIGYIVPIGEDRWFCISDSEMEGTVIGILERTDDTQDTRKVIKVASDYYDSSSNQQMIIAYNRNSTEYRIEYVSYDSKEDPQSALAMDIIAGNTPDILIMNGGVDNYAAGGILEDLKPYLEQDDRINEDYFVDGILSATAIDDRQYYLIKSFSIDTLVGRKTDMPGFENGWTFDNLIECYRKRTEGTRLFSYETKQAVFCNLIYYLDSYIDWEKGECSFDGEEFRRALEFCNEFSYESDGEFADFRMMKDKKTLICEALNINSINSTEYMQIFNQICDGEEIYIGYSGDNYKGYLNIYNRFGIVSSSENKDDAWKIIKDFMEISNSGDEFRFPASKEKFEDMVRKDMITESYIDDNGERVYPRRGGINGISVGPATENDIQTLRDLIRNSKDIDTGVYQGIIADDVAEYFSGKRSLDDTVKIIQDRMTKYVNERK